MPSSVAPSMLEAEGADLVIRLGGIWHRGGGMCHCPAHTDRTPSLSVRTGRTSLLFKCFAGCETIDVIRAIRRLDLSIPRTDTDDAAPDPHGRSSAMSARAVAIWNEAVPLGGTPAERYLAGRGIRASSPALRYHPRTPLGAGRSVQFRPALVAAIEQGRWIVAIQRIFLDEAHAALATDLAKAKMTLGRPLGGAVKLQRPSRVLGLAEGVETALSASSLLDLPVWATLGNERLQRIEIPNRIERLILLPDADRAGSLAARRSLATYARPDLVIETGWPWAGLNDWNEVLFLSPSIRRGVSVRPIR